MNAHVVGVVFLTMNLATFVAVILGMFVEERKSTPASLRSWAYAAKSSGAPPRHHTRLGVDSDAADAAAIRALEADVFRPLEDVVRRAERQAEWGDRGASLLLPVPVITYGTGSPPASGMKTGDIYLKDSQVGGY